jgi:hypothetical protein
VLEYGGSLGIEVAAALRARLAYYIRSKKKKQLIKKNKKVVDPTPGFM